MKALLIPSFISVLSAKYGQGANHIEVDLNVVTSNNGKRVTNKLMGGDPCVGIMKTLRIVVLVDGVRHRGRYHEGYPIDLDNLEREI